MALSIPYVYVICDGREGVEIIDFMMARWAHLPYEFLEEVSRRILKQVKGLSRVVYDVSSKPPATIEWD